MASLLDSRKGRLLGWSLIALVAVCLSALWLSHRWEWSTIDDPGHALLLRERIASQGPVAGMLQYARDLLDIDRTWALFRPSYWVYPSLFYVLPVNVAHLVRLAMVVIAVAGPVVAIRRQGAGWPRTLMAVALMLGASSTLYLGLFFLSLQELSAAAFIGLGLMTRRPWGRIALWTVAAWFKAPFAWLLIGEAISLWRRGRRGTAATAGAVGAGTLVIAALMARSGTYTSQYRIDPSLMMDNWPKLLEPMNSLLLVGLVWWLVVSRTRLRPSSTSLTFVVGFVGYTGQMLSWSVTAYYMGAISYLFGLLLVSFLTDPHALSGRRVAAGVALPAIIASYLLWTTVSFGLRLNSVVVGIGDCLASRPGSKTLVSGNLLYLTTSPEGPFRITQNLQLRDRAWTGDIANDDDARTGLLDPTATHYAVISPAPVPDVRAAKAVCGNDAMTLYELAAVE